jgi:uncharacterized protein (DUF427 family)
VDTYQAVWHGAVLAESDDTVVVDGYRYFPRSALRDEHFESSTHHSVCGWKGQASYYDVIVDGDRNPNAAWFYPDPKPEARAVDGRVGFWHGVEIVTVDAGAKAST